jgi:hypothetical protein
MAIPLCNGNLPNRAEDFHESRRLEELIAGGSHIRKEGVFEVGITRLNLPKNFSDSKDGEGLDRNVSCSTASNFKACTLLTPLKSCTRVQVESNSWYRLGTRSQIDNYPTSVFRSRGYVRLSVCQKPVRLCEVKVTVAVSGQ